MLHGSSAAGAAVATGAPSALGIAHAPCYSSLQLLSLFHIYGNLRLATFAD